MFYTDFKRGEASYLHTFVHMLDTFLFLRVIIVMHMS